MPDRTTGQTSRNSMVSISLVNETWTYDPGEPLGRAGGFGEVFAGFGPSEESVAIKRLHLEKSELAGREILIADALRVRKLEHVMSTLDSGLDEKTGAYYIVMPRAEQSLADFLQQRGPQAEEQAIGILNEIAAGLIEVGDLVHRDLKPGNVLRHEGRWKIADFGIARFVEESTSSKTLKGFLSPEYAAPEQWRGERCTHATDVYALGCMTHTLIRGRPPFLSFEGAIQEAHLHSAPPVLSEVSTRFQGLIGSMLRKEPVRRPSLSRLGAVYKLILPEGGTTEKVLTVAESALADAGAVATQTQVEREAERARVRARNEERIRIARSAAETLVELGGVLAEKITNIVPAAILAVGKTNEALGTKQGSKPVLRVEMEKGILELDYENHVIDEEEFSALGWDIYAEAFIEIRQSNLAYEWGASIWYGRIEQDGDCRWWEVSYMDNPFQRPSMRDEPFRFGHVVGALRDAIQRGERNLIASGPTAIDDEDIDRFCERWMERFAKAIVGELERPRRLPLSE